MLEENKFIFLFLFGWSTPLDKVRKKSSEFQEKNHEVDFASSPFHNIKRSIDWYPSNKLFSWTLNSPSIAKRPILLYRGRGVLNSLGDIFLALALLISEAFLESIPQTHLTLMLLVLNSQVLIDWGDDSDGGLSSFALFLLGFTSSVLSASLGMARLLMNGPSKLVKKQGHLGGYAQVGFALVMVSIICVLVSKALWLAFSTLDGPWRGHPLHALVWIGVSLAPQLTLVSLSKLDQKYVF